LNIYEFSRNLGENLEKLIFEVKSKIYKPVPVKVIDEERGIAILSLKDKLLQHAMASMLAKEVEKRSIKSNFGYIQGRSVYQAVDYINNMIKSQNIRCFYRCDIKRFFSSIDHQILQDKIFDFTQLFC